MLYDRNGKAITIEEKQRRSEHEVQILLNAYYNLNMEARTKLVSYAEDLLSINQYRNDDVIK